MDSVIDDLIIYKLNNFLDIKDKTKLRLVNKNFYQLETKTINFHLGTLIANFLGLDHKYNQDLEILRESPFEYLKEISKYLFNEKNVNINRTIQYYTLPISIILKIHSSSLNECKIKLRQPNIFRKYDINLNKFNEISYKSKYLSKKFVNVYAII